MLHARCILVVSGGGHRRCSLVDVKKRYPDILRVYMVLLAHASGTMLGNGRPWSCIYPGMGMINITHAGSEALREGSCIAGYLGARYSVPLAFTRNRSRN